MITAYEARKIFKEFNNYDEILECAREYTNEKIIEASKNHHRSTVLLFVNEDVAEEIKKELWNNGFTISITCNRPVVLSVQW